MTFSHMRAFMALSIGSWTAISETCLPCDPHDVPLPGPGKYPASLNGIRWPTLCIPPTPLGEEEHVFTIGDWGGIGGSAKTYDNTANKREYVWGVDDMAQHAVASLMKQVAVSSNPKYILNVGDNFYPGGIEAHCGSVDMCSYIQTGQWENIWERMYDGPLSALEWWGCFGNHDYGGFAYGRAWDQQIAFTWHHDRWILPALYWERKVVYCNFSVDYYFLDTNKFDAKEPSQDPDHNLCSMAHNVGKDCGNVDGPSSASHCVKWFARHFADQLTWLEARLEQSTADWQIIVTHFPPQYGDAIWRSVAKKYGVDIFITGHRHQQEVHYMENGRGWMNMPMGETAWTVTGGGGGVTSEANPLWESPYVQQYGFMDLTLSKEHIHIDMWSAVTRKMRRRVTVKPVPKSEDISMKEAWKNPSDPNAPKGTCKRYGCLDAFYLFLLPCQCAPECVVYRNCCPDYNETCPVDFPQPPEGERRLSNRGFTPFRPKFVKSPYSRHLPYFDEPNLTDAERCSATRRRVSVMYREVTPAPPAFEQSSAKVLQKTAFVGRKAPMLDVLPDDYASIVWDLSGEPCLTLCGGESGYCPHFCGVGKACCSKAELASDKPECKTASTFVNPQGDYECVGIIDVDGNLFMKEMGLWPPPIVPFPRVAPGNPDHSGQDESEEIAPSTACRESEVDAFHSSHGGLALGVLCIAIGVGLIVCSCMRMLDARKRGRVSRTEIGQPKQESNDDEEDDEGTKWGLTCDQTSGRLQSDNCLDY